MVACTRGVTTGATGAAEAHADGGEAVVGEEAATTTTTTTTMHELDEEKADRVRWHNGSTNEYNSVLLRVRRRCEVSRPPFMLTRDRRRQPEPHDLSSEALYPVDIWRNSRAYLYLRAETLVSCRRRRSTRSLTRESANKLPKNLNEILREHTSGPIC